MSTVASELFFWNSMVNAEICDLHNRFIFFFLKYHSFQVLALNICFIYCHVVCLCNLLGNSVFPCWKICLPWTAAWLVLRITGLCFIFTFALWSPSTTFPPRFPLQQSNVHVKPLFLCASYYTQTLTARRHMCSSRSCTQMWHKDTEDKTFPSSSRTGFESLCCEVPAAAPSQAAEPHPSIYRRCISVSGVYISLKGG